MVATMKVMAVAVSWEIELWVLQTRHIFGQGDSPLRVWRNNNGHSGSGVEGSLRCDGGNAEESIEDE